MSSSANLLKKVNIPISFSVKLSDEDDLSAMNSILQSYDIINTISTKYSFLRARIALLIGKSTPIYISIQYYIK